MGLGNFRSHPSVSVRWLFAFFVFQFVCQSALILAPVGGLRIGFRAATYLISIAMLVLVPGGGTPGPFRIFAIAVIAVTALGLAHPDGGTPFASLGSIGMTVAIWGPVFWVTRIKLTSEGLRRILIVVWGFNTLSALIGVLQVYDPERFAPDPVFIRQLMGGSADALLISLNDGSQVYRPMGLSDTPGGAAAAGSFAILGGLGLVWQTRSKLFRLAVFLAALIGIFCIYLCQVRSTLITTLLALVVMIAIHIARGQPGRASKMVAVVVAVFVGGFAWAATVGREAVTSRLESLTTESPTDTYYRNRGFALQGTLESDLPRYPLGAGLGRWGMMYAYFGDPSVPILYVEVQATAWVFDGGLFLLVIGYAAVFGAFGLTIKQAVTSRSDKMSGLATVVSAYAFGVLVVTFGYPAFIGETGMTFWVLTSALFAVRDGSFPANGGIK